MTFYRLLIVPAPGLRHLVLSIVFTTTSARVCISDQIAGTVVAHDSALSTRHFQSIIIRSAYCELLVVDAYAPTRKQAITPAVVRIGLGSRVSRRIEVLSNPAQTIQFIVGIVLLMHRVSADLIVVRNCAGSVSPG